MDKEAMNNLRQRSELINRLESLSADLQFQKGKDQSRFILTIPVKGG
jgi:hypothetical protein